MTWRHYKIFLGIMLIFILAIVVFGFLASVGIAQCVPEKDALKSWKAIYDRLPSDTFGVTITPAVCDPCTCPINGMAACYEFMAQNEREKERYRAEEWKLLERALQFGICKEDKKK
jgi:hypothetical protein